MALYYHGNYLPPASPSKSPKLGIPSSEGIGIDLYSVYLVPCPRREGEQTAEKLFRHARTSMVRTCGTTGEHSCRMLKKAAQQGRSERRGEGVRFGTLSF
jgi:hypothetical protein